MDRTLTSAEVDLLKMFANGATFAAAAKILSKSERQVRRQADVIFSVLNAQNLQHAVAIGFKCGILKEKDVNEPAPYRNLRLDARELQIFGLIDQGIANEAILKQLDISPDALRIYRNRVHAKLGVKNDRSAVRILKQHAWI